MSRKFIQIISGGTTYNVHANEIASGMIVDDLNKNLTNETNETMTTNETIATTSTSALSTTTTTLINNQQLTTTSNNNFSLRLSNISALITGRPIIPISDTIKCIVHFLDDTEHVFEVDRSAKGEELLDAVFRHLELIEREYFALQYTEIFHSTTTSTTTTTPTPTTSSSSTTTSSPINQHLNNSDNLLLLNNNNNNNVKTIVYNKWLDPTKKIRKQMRFCQQPYLLHFRVKFFVKDIQCLLEEYTRYHFYLQIRKDILSGQLCQLSTSSSATNDEQQQQQDSIMATLASYVLQSELGDYCQDEHKSGYSNEFRFLPQQQTNEFCKKIESLHCLHKGQTPADAELNYLEEAKHLELYGVDLHDAKDCDNIDIKIGVSSNGLTIYKIIFSNNNVQHKKLLKMNVFSWAKIVKISFKRRYFFIQLKHEGTERFDNLIGFNLCSYRACKSLWKSCVEQHTFFRLHTPKPLTKKFFFFFSLGSKFRYSGKTEFQTIEENRRRLTRTERIFIRNNTGRNATMPIINHNKNNVKINGNNNNEQQQQQNKLDAQKHIVNLKLSTIDNQNDNNVVSKTATATNGVITHNKFMINNHQRVLPNKNSIKSIDSTNSLISSSSEAISLLGPPSIKMNNNENNNKAKTLAIVNSNNDKELLNKKTVLSSFSSFNNHHHHKNQKLKKKHDTSHLINNNQQQQSASSTTTTTSSSTSSLESSFIPLNNEELFIKENNDLNHNNDEIDNVGDVKITTTTTKPFTPSTLISLPYIDSISTTTTTSDKTMMTKGGGDKLINNNNEISDASTIIDDDLISNDNNQDDDKRQSSTLDFDLPIHELIKELYDDAISTMPDDNDNNDNQDQDKDDDELSIVKVTMKPDEQGRFGFNVKGGNDQKCPVLISRILPNTPAAMAQPKLHEGDQVLAINGVDVANLKHEDVVQLIRSTKDLDPDSNLILSVRPNVFYKNYHHCTNDNFIVENHYDHNDMLCDPEQSPFHYTLVNYPTTATTFPQHHQRHLSSFIDNDNDDYEVDDVNPEESGDDDDDLKMNQFNSGSSLLETSMNLLHEGLQDDLLIIQFEYLPRRNEDESITIARQLENVPKNRYLDIAPYDSTRVILNECNSGDYINASFVTMKIDASNVTNRYIATQGPLKRTTSDFWQMVWEQKSTLIVMVTPLIEDGRKKCFKYWPEDNQTMIVNDLLDLTIIDCIDCGAFLERRFKMIDPENKNTHYVTHLQYLAWPDQGVPDDDTDFLKLIVKVRELRKDSLESPVIVHCSAGIGRTGVLILMETGICLIEANQPVYPLELVRTMRNQRAMLIQTSTQFRFVCEALHRVYRDQIVRPLDQFINNNNLDNNDNIDKDNDDVVENNLKDDDDNDNDNKEDDDITNDDDKIDLKINEDQHDQQDDDKKEKNDKDNEDKDNEIENKDNDEPS